MTGRDYPMIMAVVLTYGAFLAVMNLVVDLMYGVLDPASGTELGGASPLPMPRPDRARAKPALGRATTSRRRDSWLEPLARRRARGSCAIVWRWPAGRVIVLLCLIAIFADVLAPLPYTKTNFSRLNEAPSRDLSRWEPTSSAATCSRG